MERSSSVKESWSREELEEEIAKHETDLQNARNQVAIWSETAAGINGHIGGLKMMLEPTEGGEEDG